VLIEAQVTAKLGTINPEIKLASAGGMILEECGFSSGVISDAIRP
jgi:hypothetical protein